MKTVITSSGDQVSSLFDMRFGRASYYCVFDEENESNVEFVENKFKENNSGAGAKVAEFMVENGVKRVVSGDFGPKAKKLLDRFNIQMIAIEDSSLTINDIIAKFK